MKAARHCCQCCTECSEKHPNRNRFWRSATTKQIPSKNKSQRPSSDKVAPLPSHFSAFHPGYHRDQILISTHSILSNIDQTGNLPSCSLFTQHVTRRAKCHRKFRNMGENSPASQPRRHAQSATTHSSVGSFSHHVQTVLAAAVALALVASWAEFSHGYGAVITTSRRLASSHPATQLM